MKHEGNKSDVFELRDREIISWYYKLRKSLGYPINQWDICRAISIQVASRFYISDAYAINYVHHHDKCNYHGKKRELYDYFLKVFLRLKSENPNIKEIDILYLALSRPAPHFGISPMRIRIILCHNNIK